MAFYTKIFSTTCAGEFLDALNLEPTIGPSCLQIINTGDGESDFEFATALSPTEETAFDNYLAAWVCPSGTVTVSVPSEILDDAPAGPNVVWSSEKIREEILAATPHGLYSYAKMSGAGTILASNGMTGVRTGVGVYDYTFSQPYGSTSYLPIGQVNNTITDTNVQISNQTSNGFRVVIGKGDNGTSPDVVVDAEHSVSVIGIGGPTGLGSAYDTWLHAGNTGSESDFTNYLIGPQGAQGVQGSEGPQGPQGTAGPTGATGPQGLTGDTGLTGPAGPSGPQGIQGLTGDTGLTGPEGPQGPQGNIGPEGPQGEAGQNFKVSAIYNSVAELLAGAIAQNTFGLVAGTLSTTDPDYGKLYLFDGTTWTYITDMSVEGAAGVQGPKGDKGDKGDQGIQGATGAQGNQGIQGTAGWDGVDGADGATGPQGVDGPQGPKGDQGVMGPEGPQGLQGDQGIQGPQGIQGIKGDTGDQGIQGPQGLQGDTGLQGPTGLTGDKGDTGDGFNIETIFNSDADLLAGTVSANSFGLVAGTLPDTDPDYGRLYFYDGSSWTYITDMSVPGAAGVQGPKGDTGDQGSIGVTGLTGPEGPIGNTGPQGPIGNTGPQGTTGDTGPAGPQGVQGPQGNIGPQGPQGPSGTAGIIGMSHQLVFSKQGSVKNEWLNLYRNSNYSHQTFGQMPFKSNLVGITFTNKYNNKDTTIRVYSTPENGGSTPKTLDLEWVLTDVRSARKTNFPIDIMFEAGDNIGVYLVDTGSDPQNVNVILYFMVIEENSEEVIQNESGNFAVESGGGSN